MLSNELLSVVMREEVYDFKIHLLTDYGITTTIYYVDNGDGVNCQLETTLLEVANLCKSTFINYGSGYCIMSFIDFDGTWIANISGNIFKKSFQGESEQEVVINAGQWIIDLENENGKIDKDEATEFAYGLS